jgi:hypothetical protein
MTDHLTQPKQCQLCGGHYPPPDFWFHTRNLSIQICPFCSRAACEIAFLNGLEYITINSECVDDSSRVPSENPFSSETIWRPG